MRILTDLDGLVCPATTSIRAAIAALNRNPHLFQVVVDDERRVLGTLTDGDVRRGLLRDIDLGDPVERIMHRDPVVGSVDQPDIRLPHLREMRDFLPLVDVRGHLAAVAVMAPDELGDVVALIMAGGRGARLGERTQTTPKPLLPVGGRPILDHLIGMLERAGVARMFVAVHYLADQIARFVDKRGSAGRIELLYEEAPLGTAGALGLLPDLGDARVLVLNGDLMTGLDFAAFTDFHDRNGFDATIGASEHVVELPYGVIHYDESGGFLKIDEKPSVRNLVSAGIYMLSPACRRLVARGESVDMPTLLGRAQSGGLSVGVFPIHEYWQDVGRPADLEGADRREREKSGGRV